MRNRFLVMIVTIAVLLATTTAMSGYGDIDFKDGLTHSIDFGLKDVFLDRDRVTVPGFGTHGIMNVRGSAYSLTCYYASTVTMTGGGITDDFNALGFSTVTMSGGRVGDDFVADGGAKVSISGGTIRGNLEADGRANVTLTGGVIETDIVAVHSSTIEMSGGVVANYIMVYDRAEIYLIGTGFQVTDKKGVVTDLSYGDKVGDTFQRDDFFHSYYEGRITGTLSDGSSLDNAFRIYGIQYSETTADIIIIPEPCSLALLCLGSIFIRRKKVA